MKLPVENCQKKLPWIFWPIDLGSLLRWRCEDMWGTVVHPGIEVKKKKPAIFPGSWASTFYSRSFREHLGATGSTSIDLWWSAGEVGMLFTDATKMGFTQQIATQQKTWENDGKWEWCSPQNLYPTKKKWGYMEGEQRFSPFPTRPWRFPGHIQRLHRKAEEERQQRHSLVDQWPDMILKGYIIYIYMLFLLVFVWSVVIVGIWGGGVGWMMNGFLSQKMLVSFDHI